MRPQFGLFVELSVTVHGVRAVVAMRPDDALHLAQVLTEQAELVQRWAAEGRKEKPYPVSGLYWPSDGSMTLGLDIQDETKP